MALGEPIRPAPIVREPRNISVYDGWPQHELGELEGWPEHPLTEDRAVQLQTVLTQPPVMRIIGEVQRGDTSAFLIKEYIPTDIVALNVLGDTIELPLKAARDTTLIVQDFPSHPRTAAATLFEEPSFLRKPIQLRRKR